MKKNKNLSICTTTRYYDSTTTTTIIVLSFLILSKLANINHYYYTIYKLFDDNFNLSYKEDALRKLNDRKNHLRHNSHRQLASEKKD